MVTIHWPCLKELCLDNNEIGNKGLKHLSKASWNKLEMLSLCIYYLSLDKNNIGAEGIKMLGKT